MPVAFIIPTARCGVRGIPNEKQRRTLVPFLSCELLALFTEAETLQVFVPNASVGSVSSRAAGGFPDSKSDLFTSNSDGCADTFAIAFPHSALGRLILPMHLADPATGAVWVDELVLHQHGGRWIIADIVFTHDPHNRLCGKGTLRHVLHDWIHRMKGKNRDCSTPPFPPKENCAIRPRFYHG